MQLSSFRHHLSAVLNIATEDKEINVTVRNDSPTIAEDDRKETSFENNLEKVLAGYEGEESDYIENISGSPSLSAIFMHFKTRAKSFNWKISESQVTHTKG